MPKYAHFEIASGTFQYHYAVMTKKGECTLLDLKDRIEMNPKGIRGENTVERMRLQWDNGVRWDAMQPDLPNDTKFRHVPGNSYHLRLVLTKKTRPSASSSAAAAAEEQEGVSETEEQAEEPRVVQTGEGQEDNDGATDDEEPQPTKRCVIS